MTAGHLHCRVYVDQQNANNLLFDEDWTTGGIKVDATDTHADNKLTIFNLLNDGLAHTFYVFFWVDTGNAVLSLVKVQAVPGGTCSTTPSHELIIKINHKGGISFSGTLGKDGSGVPSARLYLNKDGTPNTPFASSSGNDTIMAATGWVDTPVVRVKGSVANDLNWIYGYSIILRSE
jgi:hypothetical protein